MPSSKLGDLQRKLLSLDAVTDKTVDAAIREFQPSSIPHFSLEEHLPVIERTFHTKLVEFCPIWIFSMEFISSNLLNYLKKITCEVDGIEYYTMLFFKKV